MVVCVLNGAKHIVKRKDKIYPLILISHLAGASDCRDFEGRLHYKHA